MHENSRNSFDRRHFKSESSEWTVIVIATIISALLILSYLNHIQNTASRQQDSEKNNQINLDPLIKNNSPKINQPNENTNFTAPKLSQGIHKCLMDNKTFYTESACPISSQAQDLFIVDNKMSSSHIRHHIYDTQKVAMLEPQSTTTFMSDREVQIRIKELDTTINSIAVTSENIGASYEELGYMRRHPKRLSQSDEIKRRNLRVDLERLDDEARAKTWSQLRNDIFSRY
ncbi:MAG: hypothetical protein ACAH12_09675 [Methylophilaceae bacterium]